MIGNFEKDERETVCVYEEATDSWTVETSVRKHITKLLKVYGEKHIDRYYTDENGRYTYISFKGLSIEQVSFRTKSKPRTMSEEQRQQAAERLRKARDNK